MFHKGASAYEQKEFLESFMNRRQRKESPNNAMEKPALLELLGDVRNKKILDLGCGDGGFGSELLQMGINHYTGVDGSTNMIKYAQEESNSNKATFILSNLEELQIEDNEYDLILSRMVLHYIEELEPLMHKVYTALKPGGKFIFSVMHPVITATFDHFSGKEKRTHWIVDNYFETGKRVEAWMDHSVVKYHRTIEGYISLVLAAGFKITNLKEAEPRKEFFLEEQEYQRRTKIPLFLILELEK
ncbi:class I SAM-dependent DNA methyltransferase [Bacillus sp. AK031]